MQRFNFTRKIEKKKNRENVAVQFDENNWEKIRENLAVQFDVKNCKKNREHVAV